MNQNYIKHNHNCVTTGLTPKVILHGKTNKNR